MSSWRVKIAVKLIKLLSQSQYKRFLAALQFPEQAQQRVFRDITENLSQSQYGIALKIKKNISYAIFKKFVPIISYDELIPWIEQAKHGKENILTPHKINFFEKTSGSSAAAKYIPYNKLLLNSFNNMFRIWSYDLLSYGPKFKTGRFFMSISPALSNEKFTVGNIPIGLEDDSHYLKNIWRELVKPFLVCPPHITDINNINEFRYLLAATLLAEEELEIISIWNPTYLLIIIDTINHNREDLIRDLSKGYIKEKDYHYAFPALSIKRLELLRKPSISWHELWPNLIFISCWTSSTSVSSAKKIKELFPDIFIQGKGLLATEAPMTLPLIGTLGYLPILNEVFFEFKDRAGDILLLHQLSIGESYELIISQKSGFYRYCIGDVVRVVGIKNKTPSFEFIGRINNTCDMVDEKLTEVFVLGVLQCIIKCDDIFFMLVPLIDENGFGSYLLLSEPGHTINSEILDVGLSESHHYHNARLLGQLRQSKIMIAPNMGNLVQDFLISQGMKWGNIKDKVFLTDILLAKQLIEYVTTRIVLMNMV